MILARRKNTAMSSDFRLEGCSRSFREKMRVKGLEPISCLWNLWLLRLGKMPELTEGPIRSLL